MDKVKPYVSFHVIIFRVISNFIHRMCNVGVTLEVKLGCSRYDVKGGCGSTAPLSLDLRDSEVNDKLHAAAAIPPGKIPDKRCIRE